MRKMLVWAAFSVLVTSGVALAGDPDVGCGWGTLAFRGESGVAPKVLAATTNGILGSQTFGISSGTAGCNRGGVVKAELQVQKYAGANIDKLAGDMAAGGGESLDTLAHLMGIAAADTPAFFRLTKTHFGELFPAEQVTAGAMLTTLKGLMAEDPQLAKYVS
jgi:hypothetical protein